MGKLDTPLCRLLKIRYPIFLAGMGVKGDGTPSQLVAAVTNAGGLGVIGGAAYGPDRLREIIRATRRLTDGPIGVNVIVPLKGGAAPAPSPSPAEMRAQIAESYPEHLAFVASLFEQFGLKPVVKDAPAGNAPKASSGSSADMFAAQLEVLADERVEVVAPALGSCGAVVERFRGTHTKVIALSGKVDHGQRNCAEGADAIVAQGMEAGGHIGSISNFALVPGMVDAVSPVPVIAAGAISDGRGLAAALALGAQGAWIGTAFLAAEEASINDAHKAQIVSGGVSDFVPSPVYAGADVRLYRNDVVRAWQASGLKPLPGRLQRVLMEDFDAAAQAAGRYDLLSNPAGQGAGIIHAVKPAGAIISEMVEVANKVLG